MPLPIIVCKMHWTKYKITFVFVRSCVLHFLSYLLFTFPFPPFPFPSPSPFLSPSLFPLPFSIFLPLSLKYRITIIFLRTIRHRWTRPTITPALRAGTRFIYQASPEGWKAELTLMLVRPISQVDLLVHWPILIAALASDHWGYNYILSLLGITDKATRPRVEPMTWGSQV